MARGLEDDARSYIILSYIQAINPLSFIFGVDLESISFLSQYNYNPHNSYISLHAAFGIISFLFYVPAGYYVVRELIDRHMGYAICIVAYLLRIGTDSVIGFNILSFIFLTLTLLGLQSMAKDLKIYQRNISEPILVKPQLSV
ncbi:MAG: hypothetical protein BWY08_01314 [Bacteroidetes bacterium ADurb.Bin174]|nr:MAG: hypothetical protein BWY08_01314 [Bacteroidetes bacterium ADurb.Bin174]